MANDLLTIPKSPYEAQLVINLPGGVFKAAMDDAWDKSYYTRTGYHTRSTLPSKTPDVQECGFTVFKDRQTQEMHSLNPRCSNSQKLDPGSKDSRTGFGVDLEYPNTEYRPVGFVHSHPGVIKNTLVKSLDATDAGVMLAGKMDFVMIVTGSGVVELYLRTGQTKDWFKDTGNAIWVDKNFKAGEKARQEIAKKTGLGYEWEQSAEKNAIDVAQHYSLALYRGTGLLLRRLWPAPNEKPPKKHKVPDIRRNKPR